MKEDIITKEERLNTKKDSALITIKISRKDFVESYTVRVRVGIWVARILGIVSINYK